MGGDIRVQLPDEARKFDDIDKAYRRTMMDCVKNPLVIPICTSAGRLLEFQGLVMGLEKLQKSLNDYLDSKRRIFPRQVADIKYSFRTFLPTLTFKKF